MTEVMLTANQRVELLYWMTLTRLVAERMFCV